MRSRVQAALLVAGALWCLALWAAHPGEVFYNGDGGIKFLMTRQAAAGDLHPDLRPEAPAWAAALWDSGLYPFHPPTVYTIDGKRFAQYPPYFPVLSAPFYRLFGFRGLTIVPFVSLVLLWVVAGALCARLRMTPWATGAALAALIFGSHLTAYGAMFWEHTPATLLALVGLAGLLHLRLREPPAGAARAAAGGLLGGLSVWFRSEFLLFTGFLAVAALLPVRRGGARREGMRQALWFAAGLGASVAGYLLANRLTTGVFLGLHSWQTRYSMTPEQKLFLYPEVARWLLRDLLLYFPASLVPLALLLRPARGAHEKTALGHDGLLLSLGFAYLALIPLLVPSGAGREWGPRYLLILVPIASLLAGLVVDRTLEARSRSLRVVVLAFVAAALALGIWRNLVFGTRYLLHVGRTRVAPALEFVLARPQEVVAVSRQWIAQDLAAAIGRKVVFRTSTFADLARLGETLDRQGIGGFLYLSLPGEPSPPTLPLASTSRTVTFSPAGQFGQFRGFIARIN